MAEEDDVGREGRGLRGDLPRRSRAELSWCPAGEEGLPPGLQVGVEEADFVAVVDQGPAYGQQPERRQVVVRDAAADRGVGDVDEEDSHGILPRQFRPSASRKRPRSPRKKA